ncbi:MAG: hypothetical protein ABEH38_01740 [Flavobacteriales bacterium]
MRNGTKAILAAFFLFFSLPRGEAHEPLYGFGPHVLFQGGFGPHLTFHQGPHHIETEYALGYGITKDWTVKAEAPFHIEEGSYEWAGLKLKQKYRIFSSFEKGSSIQISGLTSIHFPGELKKPTVTNIGLTGGKESLRWYWFFGAVYGVRSGTVPSGEEDGHHHGSDQVRIAPGDHLIYNATLGYRPIKTGYYKPDIVFFLEGLGKYQRPSLKNGELLKGSDGHNWSLAPTFMFTYKNIALRGGVEIGLANSGGLNTPETNYKLILEWHL